MPGNDFLALDLAISSQMGSYGCRGYILTRRFPLERVRIWILYRCYTASLIGLGGDVKEAYSNSAVMALCSRVNGGIQSKDARFLKVDTSYHLANSYVFG